LAEIEINAPGRVCLFGDHQDYLGLPIIACAIDRHITLRANSNASKKLHIHFLDLKQTRNISLPYDFCDYNPNDTLIAALKVLKQYGCSPNMGYDIQIQGTIPINAGLSSSSALLVTWVSFLIKAFGIDRPVSQELIAKLAYKAEVVERQGPGGKMDQYSISLGNIIYLETGKNTTFKTIGTALKGLVIGESGISKDTLGLLADRRSLAVEGLEILGRILPNFNVAEIGLTDCKRYADLLPKKYRPYFKAAVENHLITQSALLEFKKKTINLERLGHLMTAHHTILKDDLKITVQRIDAMIDAALSAGAIGAKIVGSGGGGCIVAIAPGNEDKVIDSIIQAGAVNAYKASVSKGIMV
jgi:galactokinase